MCVRAILCTCVFACTYMCVCMHVCVCNQQRMLHSSSAVSLTFGLHCIGTHQGDYAPLLASAGTSLSTDWNGKCTSPCLTHLHGSGDDIRLLILAYMTCVLLTEPPHIVILKKDLIDILISTLHLCGENVSLKSLILVKGRKDVVVWP